MLGLIVLVLAIARYVLTAGKIADALSVIASLAGVLVIIARLVQWLWKALRPTGPPPSESVNSAADRLADPVMISGPRRLASADWKHRIRCQCAGTGLI